MKTLLFGLIAALALPAAAQNIPVTPTTEVIYMNLGRVPYNGSARGALQLKNTGPGDLTNIVWDLRAFGFHASDNCPKALAPGKSCNIYVSYWNTHPGPASGTLYVRTSDKNYRVNLSVYGEDDPFRNAPRPPRYP